MNCFAGGVSICGSRHTQNQDAVAFHNYENGWLITVSDGLGSKKKSEKGSKKVCETVWSCACEFESEKIFQDPVGFLYEVHCRWLHELGEEDIEEFCATVLILLIVSGKALAMQLGDGFISVCADGRTLVLIDDKSDHYINETDCFQQTFSPELVRYHVITFNSFESALLCSDGVEIGEMTEKDIAEFTRCFAEGFSGMVPGKVEQDVRKWLSQWPGTDDKTAAYLLPKNKGAL